MDGEVRWGYGGIMMGLCWGNGGLWWEEMGCVNYMVWWDEVKCEEMWGVGVWGCGCGLTKVTTNSLDIVIISNPG